MGSVEQLDKVLQECLDAGHTSAAAEPIMKYLKIVGSYHISSLLTAPMFDVANDVEIRLLFTAVYL